LEDPTRPAATLVTGTGLRRRIKVAQLDPQERRRLLGGTDTGLEPVGFWSGEHGWPLSPSRWKKMFAEPNTRSHRHAQHHLHTRPLSPD
jgi:hypothetical protein